MLQHVNDNRHYLLETAVGSEIPLNEGPQGFLSSMNIGFCEHLCWLRVDGFWHELTYGADVSEERVSKRGHLV
jgi:hypothetical protein